MKHSHRNKHCTVDCNFYCFTFFLFFYPLFLLLLLDAFMVYQTQGSYHSVANLHILLFFSFRLLLVVVFLIVCFCVHSIGCYSGEIRFPGHTRYLFAPLAARCGPCVLVLTHCINTWVTTKNVGVRWTHHTHKSGCMTFLYLVSVQHL
jgi:hypothetical protein